MSKNKNTLWIAALALGVTLLWISYDDQIVDTIQSLRYDPSKAMVEQAQTGSDKDLAKVSGDETAKSSQKTAQNEQNLAQNEQIQAQGSGELAESEQNAGLDVNEGKFSDLLVAASANNPADKFFAEYRLERDRVRGQQVDNLREIINNPKSVGDTVREAQKRLLTLNENLTKELLVENMLRAKNYNDAIVFLQDEAVTVIVQAKELGQQDIAKISDLVTRTTGKGAREMVIIPKN